VSLAAQQMAFAVLLDSHQSRLSRASRKLAAEIILNYFLFIFKQLGKLCAGSATLGTVLALILIEQMLKRVTNSTF
jgi:hypothetical protein